LTEELTATYRDMVRQSEDRIGAYLRQQLPLSLDRVEVFDRAQWIDANIIGFQLLFEPLETMNQNALRQATIGAHLFGELNQTVLSGQLGLLMGYLSRRVLGQYDTALLGREPMTTGRLYFVEPNIAQTQGRLNLEGADFRTWIALHETTHAFEFEAHPWLRDYMNSLLRQYFDTVGQDLGRFALAPGGMVGLAQRVYQNASKTHSALELFMTEEQQQIFQKLQALMCLLEGYSNHVMDVVGNTVLETYPFMKRRFEARNQNRSAAEQIFARITGLDMKLEQYVLGEKFVNRVVGDIGIDRFNRVWEGPTTLPMLSEIYEPERWRERVAG
jgi:coenzyme F420 biosynthesis associated uncharacterized protein